MSSWARALTQNSTIKRNEASFKEKTGLPGIIWRFAQGAIVMSCADDTGEELKGVIEKLKQLGENPSKFYTNMRDTLDEKVMDLLFDNKVEDGLNQEIVNKPLVKVFSRSFSHYWKARVKEAKK